MPNGILDMDGCGDGDRGLQANSRWTLTPFASVSTAFGAFGYGLQCFNEVRAFAPNAWPLIGWHMNIRTWNNPAAGPSIEFREGSLVCCTLRFPSSGAILIYDATGTLRGTIPAGTWPFQAWAYIEVALKVDNGAGSIEIWLFGNNGTADITISGIDTLPAGGTGVCDNQRWYQVEGNLVWIDDWYLMDGAFFNVGLGGIVIDTQDANGDDLAEWTPSGGGGNFEQINERPFSASDNVSTGVDGAKDRYTLAASGNDAEVYAVRVIGQVKKTDVAIAKARLLIDDAGTQGNGATRTLLTDAQVVADVFKERPSDSSDWDEASVDALLIGVERVAA